MAMRRRDGQRAPVLHLGMGWFPDETGGLNRYFRGLVETLAAQGEPVRAVVVGPASDAPAYVDAAAHRDDPLWTRLRAFARAARSNGGDARLVHAHFALYSLLPVVFGSQRRKPLVLQFQGPWADEAEAAGRAGLAGRTARRFVERRVYRRADAAVVLSSAFRRILVERYGVPPWFIDVIPPGVDLEVYSPGDRAEARAALGLPDGGFVAVSARRLVPRMGLHVLVEAWREVRRAYPDAVLLIAGTGPERTRLERLAGDGVRFLGNLGDDALPVAYRAADVSVVPTVSLEGFGIICLESLACGTPVIATDAGGLPEVVAPLDASLVVQKDNEAALSRRLLAAAGGELPTRDESRSYAERFTWKIAAEKHLAVYRRVLEPVGRPLRVVYVDHCAQLAGGEIALLRLLPALEGVQPHVILGEDGPFAERLARAGISVEVLPFSQSGVRRDALGGGAALRTLPYTLRLARRLRVLRPDVVHTNSLKAALYGGAAARLARVPCVWHIRDRIADDYLPARAVRAVHAAARRLPAAVIANSRTTAAALPENDMTVIVPSPVDFATDCYKEAPGGPLCVGIVGRLAPWKGQDVFLEAFARGAGDTDARAVVVGEALFGEDDFARGLRALATRLDLDGRVEFTGFADDVRRELGRLDVLVHASVLPEPFGLAVVEGMAAGLPVVAADAGGPAEVIRDGVDGLLYPPGDVDALAQALRSLLRDPELRARLGEAARERAREFAPERVAAQVLNVYRSVVRS